MKRSRQTIERGKHSQILRRRLISHINICGPYNEHNGRSSERFKLYVGLGGGKCDQIFYLKKDSSCSFVANHRREPRVKGEAGKHCNCPSERGWTFV